VRHGKSKATRLERLARVRALEERVYLAAWAEARAAEALAESASELARQTLDAARGDLGGLREHRPALGSLAERSLGPIGRQRRVLEERLASAAQRSDKRREAWAASHQATAAAERLLERARQQERAEERRRESRLEQRPGVPPLGAFGPGPSSPGGGAFDARTGERRDRSVTR
jgi:hypothetical protein